MDTGKILRTRKENLLLPLALTWLVPGINVLRIGVKALKGISGTEPGKTWWLALTAIAVAVAFSLMFNKFIKRYTARILSFEEERKSIFSFLDREGYILILFMIGLGISLKFIPNIPAEFFAGFYSGLGFALITAGIRFLASWIQAIRHRQTD